MSVKKLGLGPKDNEDETARLKQLKKMIRKELQGDCRIYGGTLTVSNNHIDMKISNISDVEKVNWEYEIIKIQYQSIDMEDFIMSFSRGARIAKFEELAGDIYWFYGEEFYFKLLSYILTDLNWVKSGKYALMELLFNSENTILELMYDEELSEFEKLPDILTIYRGISVKNLNDDLEEYMEVKNI